MQIDYEDWLRIEQALAVQEPNAKDTGLASFSGILRLEEDPLEYQKRIRKEWS